MEEIEEEVSKRTASTGEVAEEDGDEGLTVNAERVWVGNPDGSLSKVRVKLKSDGSIVDMEEDENDRVWKAHVREWTENHDAEELEQMRQDLSTLNDDELATLNDRLLEGERVIEEIRKMNPKPYRASMSSVSAVRRVGFRPQDDDVEERSIRIKANQEGKIILGRM